MFSFFKVFQVSIVAILAVIVIVSAVSCSSIKAEQVTVKGSDTEVNLVQEMAERFMEADAEASMTITGGGSGYGIASLINQKTDIANSSRALNSGEKDLISKKQIQVYEVVFAQDAIAIIVNSASKITEMTLEDAGKIYRGEIKNWKELGGADLPISLYGRQSNSGTFVYFREKVVKGEYSQDVKQLNGTAQLVESVKQDASGIGYVGIGYLLNKQGETNKGIIALNLKDGDKPAVSALDKSAIIDGRYPLVRPLFQFTNGVPQGKALDFLRYELSEEGQKIVESNGYFPINQKYREKNAALGIGL